MIIIRLTTPGARLALLISYSMIIIIGISTNLAILAPFLNNKVMLVPVLVFLMENTLIVLNLRQLAILASCFSPLQAMRTPRNIFVINLAISDLLLCSFTIPFTLADSLTAFWELGPEMVRLFLFLSQRALTYDCF